MTHKSIVRVADVMKREVDIVDGKLTVKEALLNMKYPETRAMIVDQRDADDEYGIVLVADIAKKILAENRSPERVNLYEIMAKPVLSVLPGMDIRYCARLLERFEIARAPVIENGQVLGIVSYHDMVLRGMLQSIRGESVEQ